MTRVRCPACGSWIVIAETPAGPWAFDPAPVDHGTHMLIEVAGRLFAQQIPEGAASLLTPVDGGARYRTHERTCVLAQTRGRAAGLYERWVAR